MSPGRYRKFLENGIGFIFKVDPDDPSLLHIYARHLTTVDDAIDVFFDPSATQHFNDEMRRYERHNQTHGLYWFWIEEPRAVMVITCFKKEIDDGYAS